MEKREGGREEGKGVWKKGREGVRRIREEGRGMEGRREGGRDKGKEGGCKNK